MIPKTVHRIVIAVLLAACFALAAPPAVAAGNPAQGLTAAASTNAGTPAVWAIWQQVRDLVGRMLAIFDTQDVRPERAAGAEIATAVQQPVFRLDGAPAPPSARDKVGSHFDPDG